MSHAKDRAAFVAQMAKEGMPADVALAILRDAQVIQTIAVRECSEEMSEAEARRVEKREKEAIERITQRAKPYVSEIKVGGDPRGYCVKLILKSGKYNTWGGPEDGFGVPAKG